MLLQQGAVLGKGQSFCGNSDAFVGVLNPMMGHMTFINGTQPHG